MSKIKKLRVTADLTQDELGKKVGVNQSTVAAWESGRSRPRSDMLVHLADVLGVTVDELLREEKNHE